MMNESQLNEVRSVAAGLDKELENIYIQEKTSVNPFRSWFKDTSAYKKSGKTESDGTTNTKSDGITENDIKNLAPKVGVFSVGASGTVAVNASVISNDMEGHITSEVKNSTISAEKFSILYGALP